VLLIFSVLATIPGPKSPTTTKNAMQVPIRNPMMHSSTIVLPGGPNVWKATRTKKKELYWHQSHHRHLNYLTNFHMRNSLICLQDTELHILNINVITNWHRFRQRFEFRCSISYKCYELTKEFKIPSPCHYRCFKQKVAR